MLVLILVAASMTSMDNRHPHHHPNHHPHHRRTPDGSSYYVVPGADTQVNGQLLQSPTTVQGSFTLTTYQNDATVYTLTNNGNYCVEAYIYGSGVQGVKGTDAICSASNSGFDAEIGFKQGSIFVDDESQPSPSLRNAFTRTNLQPDPKHGQPRRRGVLSLRRFRLRRLLGSGNTTFAGYGTTYEVAFTGNDPDEFSFEVYSSTNPNAGGQVLFKDSPDGSIVYAQPQGLDGVVVATDANGKSPPLVSAEPQRGVLFRKYPRPKSE
jgi:hypothetical protein